MIQFQYYHKGLSKLQIENIINNYKLKYTTLTNEIVSKLNYLIKTVLNDIYPFLENIKEVSKDINNIKEIENCKKKIELLENKLFQKSLNEHQLKNDIISLKKEISNLKLKKIAQNKENESSSQEKEKTILKKKTLDLNITTDNQGMSTESINLIKKNNNNKKEEYFSKFITPSDRSKSNNKKESPKNKNKNDSILNMQEITKDLNGYLNIVHSKRDMAKANKFICTPNKRNIKKNTNNNQKPNKSMMLSLTVDSTIDNKKINLKNDINEDNINRPSNNNYDYDIIEEEEIEDEIKELEIDEQCILQLIEDIKDIQKLGNKIV